MSIFKSEYDHQLIKKYCIAFGTLFDSMVIIRKDTNGVEQERYTIPLAYSPKEKFIQRIMADPELLRKEGITLPRMSYELTTMQYNAERKLSSKRTVGVTNTLDSNTKIAFSNPVAYDLYFNLYIGAKTLTDMYQIIEQIFPAFTPDYTISLRVFDAVSNFNIDIPISLIGNNLQDNTFGDISERRVLIWTLQFILKGYLIGPVKNKPIIKTVDFDLQDINQESVIEADKIDLDSVRFIPVVDGKLLNEIYETDNWELSTIFGI